MSLQHAWRELAQHYPQALRPIAPGSTSIAIAPPPGASACQLVETLQRSFLLQIRNVEVHLRLPLHVTRGARLQLHHRGWFLRGELACATSAADESILRAGQRICANERVQQSIAHVDFTRLELLGEGDTLCMQLALYGGSELRSPLPGLQRYVRLGSAQTAALSAALHVIAHALTL